MNLRTMTDQFDWLSILTYPATAISGGLVGGLLLLVIQTFLKKGITHEFDKSMQRLRENHDKTLADIRHEYDKRLSSFNADIAKEVDKETRNFQREIHDFTLYSTKRHEIYPELYKQLYNLQHSVSQVNIYSDSCSKLSKTQQIVTFLECFGYSLSERARKHLDETFNTFKDDKDKLRENLKRILEMELLYQARLQFSSVQALFQGNMIYMSDEATTRISDFLKLLYRYLADQTFDNVRTAIDMRHLHDGKGILGEIIKGMEEIKDLFKKELSIGYYED